MLYDASDRDPYLYALLDTFATYYPGLLLPVERPASRTRRGGTAGRQNRVCLRHWAQTLGQLHVPDMVPGLCIHVGDSTQSSVPRLLHLALLVGVGSRRGMQESEVGARLAASVGRLLAVNHVYRRRQHRHRYGESPKQSAMGPNDVPLFDPVASVMLDQLYVRCSHLGHVPSTLLSFLAHVVHSVGADAVVRLQDEGEGALAAWEEAWRPSLVALARLMSLIPPMPWEDLFPPLLRPLGHLATMEGVSDATSGVIVRGLISLLAHWAEPRWATEALAQKGAAALFPWLLVLEDALLMDGDPTLPIYHAALALHSTAVALGGEAATSALYPFPFYILAVPPAMTGSIATLSQLVGIVARLREHVQQSSTPAAPVNEMILALVDTIWSGRAFGSLLQHGLTLDGHLVMDAGTVAAVKQVCDAQRIVPFVLVGSLSHGALLAPLLEVFTNEVLLPANGHPFIRAPITPSALRAARQHGLPAHMQYTDIRAAFLHWLAERGAPSIETLLQASVPSLKGNAATLP